jgi:hypothetical protein
MEPAQGFVVQFNPDRHYKGVGVMSGQADKAKGSLKETAGKATGDKRQ